MNVVVVVGNPKPMSRTRAAAELVAEQLTGKPPARVIDVVDLGPALLGWGDPQVAEAKQAVLAADLLIVASPTFKATSPNSNSSTLCSPTATNSNDSSPTGSSWTP